jgi:hypothetical protein
MDGMRFSLVCCFFGWNSMTPSRQWEFVGLSRATLSGSVGNRIVARDVARLPYLPPLSVAQLPPYIRPIFVYFSSPLYSPAPVPAPRIYLSATHLRVRLRLSQNQCQWASCDDHDNGLTRRPSYFAIWVEIFLARLRIAPQVCKLIVCRILFAENRSFKRCPTPDIIVNSFLGAEFDIGERSAR